MSQSNRRQVDQSEQMKAYRVSLAYAIMLKRQLALPNPFKPKKELNQSYQQAMADVSRLGRELGLRSN